MKIALFVSLLSLQSIANSGPQCADNLKELAGLHLALKQDPSMGFELQPAITAGIIGAGGGASVGHHFAKKMKVRPVKSHAYRTAINGMNQSVRGMRPLLQIIAPTKPVSDRTVARDVAKLFAARDQLIARKGLLTVQELGQLVDSLLKDYGVASDSQKRRLTQSLVSYDEYRQQRKPGKEVGRSIARRELKRKQMRVRIAGVTGGAAVGLAAILGGNYVRKKSLEKVCSEYDVSNLIGFFEANYVGALSGSNVCMLTDRGASLLMSDSNKAKDLCARYPKIEQALGDSLDSLFSMTHQRISAKKDVFLDSKFDCKASMVETRVADTVIKLKFQDNGTQFNFNQRGSGAGPNSGFLTLSPGGELPVFDNTVGARLRYDMSDGVDYSTLTQYFMGKPGAPIEPTKRRRYLVGSALLGATLLRPAFDEQCPRLVDDEVDNSSTD